MAILAEIVGIVVLITLVGFGVVYFLKDIIKSNEE